MGLQPYDLKCENLPNPTSIDTPRPHFSWKLTSPRKDDCQTAYEIQVGRDSLKLTKGKADLWNTGKVIGREQIMLPWKGVELTAGDYCYWRVRVYDRDGNASTMTLQTMFDAAPTYYNWLQAWADAQDEDGGMPHVAPAGGGGGGPYWCGFIVQAPYRAYLNYADDRMLTKHYDNMQRWLEYVKKYTRDGLLGRWPDTKNRMWFLGDWLTPMGVDAGNEKSVMLVSNCFVSECLQSMTRMAEHLGRTEDAMAYAEWRNELNRTIHERFFNAEDCTYATGSPLDMAYALNVGVVPQELYNKVNERLVELSRTKYNTHIAVGLVGVPIFTEWATRNREAALMYDILKQEDYPGYLNMIRNGATTTWESWDRSRSRIHNCYNGIGTWFYQALGGIVPDPDYPGYEHFTVSPQLVDGIDWVKVTKECPYGTITVEWTRNGDDVDVVVECPIGTSY